MHTLYLSDCIFILELSRLLDNNSSITEVLYGEQSIVDTLSQFLTRHDGIDLCNDSKTVAKVLDIYKKRMSFDPSTGSGLRIRFLTDIKTDNISHCKEL